MSAFDPAGVTIGDRLQTLRRARALTQEQLAEISDVSVETIRKLEQNERTTARVSTLRKLSGGLGVATSALFGTSALPVVLREVDDDDLALIEIRRVLSPIRGLAGVLGGPEVLAPTAAELGMSINAVDRAYHRDDYAAAMTAIPLVLAEADAAVLADRTPQTLRLQSQAYQLAGDMLIQLRRFDLAHRALDRALQSAADAGDELVGGAAIVTLCWLLLRQGRFDEAEHLSVSTADAIEPSFSRSSPEHLATWGWLLLRGSAAMARNNRDDRAGELLDAAAAAAVRISGSGGPVFS